MYISQNAEQAAAFLGQIVASRRRQKGESQALLAERLCVSRATLSALESGSPKVSAGTLLYALDLVGALNTVCDALVRSEGEATRGS